jgi:hypothetical protein
MPCANLEAERPVAGLFRAIARAQSELLFLHKRSHFIVSLQIASESVQRR